MSEFGILSLLPPILAILLAILTKRILIALFVGIWMGGLLIAGGNPIDATVTTLGWVVTNVTDTWNAEILIFTFFIGGAVGIIYKSGGANAIAEALRKRINTSRSSILMTYLLGIIIFFCDYTNTIIVGNTMRPVNDKMRVSREMLAYVVDSTAAPVVGMAMFSTWIGYELSLIQSSFEDLGITMGAYEAWLRSVPYMFYPILAIILVFLVAYTHRHYGPMLKAEYRARTTGKVLRDGAKPLMTTEVDLGKHNEGGNIWNFILPLFALIIVIAIGLWYTGGGSATYAEEGLMGVLGNSDSALVLVWASFAMLVVAIGIVVLFKQMNLEEIENTVVQGMKQMLYACAITVLAWSIKSACDAVGTAPYVVNLAVQGGISAAIVPFVIFIISAFIAFSTGTSWGTFAIMMPIAISLAYQISGETGAVLSASIAAVFGGGIFGDHCSPISDTTIMSSMFSGSDHIDHVSTQLPYAVTAAIVGAVLYALFAIGIRSWPIILLIGLVLLIVAHYILSEWYGKRSGIPHGKVPIYRS